MLLRNIVKFPALESKFMVPIAFHHSHKSHTDTCPTVKKHKVCPGSGMKKVSVKRADLKRGPICPGKGAVSGGGAESGSGARRAMHSGKCRMGFIPEEWFQFLKPMTGVSGPYFLMLGLGNYMASKEIYVMEHEYYLGLSVALILYLLSTRLGPKIGAALDKEVDAVVNELEKGRKDIVADNQKQIKDAETAIWRAQGQRSLIEAKKDNIAVQLEAIYRERLMYAYRTVRNRMDYHIKRHRIENRVHQKWMIKWILENVHKSITSDFKKQAMNTAITDLALIANRAKN